MKQIDKMTDRENLGWCKPMFSKTADGKDAVAAINEGSIAGLMIDGHDYTAAELAALDYKALAVLMLGNDYNCYAGYTDKQLAIDAFDHEAGCHDCPWRDICDAVNEDVED